MLVIKLNALKKFKLWQCNEILNIFDLFKDGDVNWGLDVSAEAVRARMQDLTDGAKGLTIDEDTDKTEKERMDIFYNKVYYFMIIRLSVNVLSIFEFCTAISVIYYIVQVYFFKQHYHPMLF